MIAYIAKLPWCRKLVGLWKPVKGPRKIREVLLRGTIEATESFS